jgi:hypothetical protein
MRRLAVALIAVGLVAGVPIAAPGVAQASTDTSYTTTVTVGASRTLPSGAFGFSDGCQVGYSGTTEYRCAFEFDISIPSTAKITAATVSIRKTSGNCAQDCPVDMFAYTGNGSDDLADVSAGSLVRIFTPTGSTMNLDVSADLQSRVSNGLDWIGYRMARNASSPRNPDVQDFDMTGTDRVRLNVSYVAQPVDVTVHLGGLGDGVVTSSPGGISCGEFCDATFEYAEPVTLTATPDGGDSFSHWEGGECNGSTNPVCEFIVPALNMDTTAVFNALGPPISMPPPTPTPPQLTPPPLTAAPTSRASSGPITTGGPAPTGVPAPTDVIASDGTVITPAPTQAAVASGAAPTILGLGGEPGDAEASGGIGLPLVILLILVLGLAVGGGVYWYTKRSQAAGP